jgi:hypothetical protein
MVMEKETCNAKFRIENDIMLLMPPDLYSSLSDGQKIGVQEWFNGQIPSIAVQTMEAYGNATILSSERSLDPVVKQ